MGSAAPAVPPPARRSVFALAGVLGAFWAAFAFVRPTNFGGWDEWLVVSLTSDRIIDLPYENRPLSLVFNAVATLLAPDRLLGFYLVHAAYLCLGAWLVFRLAERLLPEQPQAALLCGVFAAVWAPLDYMRLDVVLCANYSGATLGVIVATTLLLESNRRGHLLLLALAGLMAAFVLRSLESAAGLLLGAPLLLWALPGARRRGVWTAGWMLFVLPALAAAAWPLVAPGAAPSYQTAGLGVDLSPVGVLGRLARQVGFQVAPLVSSDPRELVTPAVPLAVTALVVAALGSGFFASATPPGGRRALLGLLGIGAGAAVLGYFPMVLSKAITTPARTQMLSAPGMGLFLGAIVALVAGFLAPRWRGAGALAIAAWIAAVASGRTVAMQRYWDEASYWTGQSATLRGLLREAPALAPHTFVLVLDDDRSWPANFTFYHAVRHLYEGRAIGGVPGAEPFLYPFQFDSEGLVSLPTPAIRRAWRSPVTRHRFDELVVVRHAPSGEVELLGEWPSDPRLPPLPAGARYAPRERIVAAAPATPRARILD
jgi:hypothetical protein